MKTSQHGRERRYHGKEDGTTGTAQLLRNKRPSEGAWVNNYSKNIMGTWLVPMQARFKSYKVDGTGNTTRCTQKAVWKNKRLRSDHIR